MHELIRRAIREFVAIFPRLCWCSHQQMYLPLKLLINEKQIAADAQMVSDRFVV